MSFTLNKVKHEIRSAVTYIHRNAPSVILKKSRGIGNGFVYKINNMPDEKREKIRLKLKETIKQIKPFMDEFKLLLKDIPPEKTKK